MPSRVFITENEINFLAFPAWPTAAIFGAGYGFDMLAQAPGYSDRSSTTGATSTPTASPSWTSCAALPHAQSFLMDRATLMAHRPQWMDEPQPALRDLPRLDDEERALFDDLRWKRLGNQQIRLEQEQIGFGWIAQALRSRFAMGHD